MGDSDVSVTPYGFPHNTELPEITGNRLSGEEVSAMEVSAAPCLVIGTRYADESGLAEGSA